ncbi:unnamed protein product [Thelazia callipaeda]|uniref:MADF domain-containing protein n=1 Tax=Thelazia callipaeda TaxID=103827 RepID=A0A158RBU6_THECL|nr:unnamed protein product [Thelazia callipaeda]
MPSPCCLNPPGEPSFNEILIKTVREYPALYSNQRRAFENVDRCKIWDEVAGKIGRGVTGEFAKKRWLQLRDRYRKELKISIAHNFTQPQKWSHFSLLSWLDPYLQGAIPIAPNGTTACYTLDNINTTCNSDAFYENFAAKLSSDLTSDGNEEVSDCFDEIKPVMSTLQSVLAAAEATANWKEVEAIVDKAKDLTGKLESNAFKVYDFAFIFKGDGENISDNDGCSSKASKDICGCASPSSQVSIVSTVEEGNQPKNNLLSRDCIASYQESRRQHGTFRLSVVEGGTITTSPCTSEGGMETEEISHINGHYPAASQDYHNISNTVSPAKISLSQRPGSSIEVIKTGSPVSFKSSTSHVLRNSPYRLPAYSNVRFRTRNMKKQQQQQQHQMQHLNFNKVYHRVNSTNSTSSNNMDSDWMNDEEMLFARFVGLRLKKLNSHSRSMARMKIMQVLDGCEQEILDEGE